MMLRRGYGGGRGFALELSCVQHFCMAEAKENEDPRNTAEEWCAVLHIKRGSSVTARSEWKILHKSAPDRSCSCQQLCTADWAGETASLRPETGNL